MTPAEAETSSTASPIGLAVVRAYLTMARQGGRRPGALAIQARPTWSGDRELAVAEGVRAVIVPCVSALAVREALLSRPRDQWLVILTDRDDEDLGTGITSYLIHGKVRIPNLWDAVADQFAASQRDPQLVNEGRQLAATLLAETPPDGWPPARGGVLTRDVAFEALTGRVLGLPAAQLDPLGLLEWSTDPQRSIGLQRLSPNMAEKLFGWLASRTGPLGAATITAARTGALADAVPFAILSGLLVDPALPLVPRAEARGLVGGRLGAPLPGDDVSRGWAADARTALERLLHGEHGRGRAHALLGRAESILGAAGAVATGLAAASDVLPKGLQTRRQAYARAIRAVAEHPDPDQLTSAETAFAHLAAHLLAEHDPGERLRLDNRDRMALRLARWLAIADTTPETLGAAVARHLDTDGWVDRARADVWAGVLDPTAEDAYRALYNVVTARRAAHDRVFANLAEPNFARPIESGSFGYLEDVLASTILPIAAHGTPTLLVLADGMSAAVANELAEQIAALGWVEQLRTGRDSRLAALTLAPSVTEVCRTSLFCGAPRRGQQAEERAGLTALARTRQVTAALFHKDDLERSTAGSALPHRIVDALEDRAVGLVAVVLNTIDESLAHTGPEHEPWTVDRVAHLRNLLTAAHMSRRAVVLTADHGHVVERRGGNARPVNGATSARSRAAVLDGGIAATAGDGEIVLRGPRVIAAGGAVIMPWQEDIRYTALNAGYHGGASPAEMVVPVLVFALPGQEIRGWHDAAPQQPIWWLRGTATVPPRALVVESPASREPRLAFRTPVRRPRDVPADAATLFDLPGTSTPTAPVAEQPTEAANIPAERPSITEVVLASETYSRQRKRLGRQPIDEQQVAAAIHALLEAGQGGLSNPVLAAVLRQPEYRIRGFVVTLQRLLNIEGYEVVSVDADGSSVVLDERLLREQFELGQR